MASYQGRRRAPLLDRGTQAVVERRGREVLGLTLIGVGGLIGVLLGSYSPDDPGWMVATDAPAQNALGRLGAALASVLIILGGLGAWSLAVLAAIWGLRFVTHRGQERVLGRLILAPVAIVLATIFAATHAPGAAWPHAFGLGGLVGDTLLGTLIGIAPADPGTALRVLSLLTGLALMALALHVTGFDRAEMRATGRFLRLGFVQCWHGALIGLDAGLRLGGAIGGRAAEGLGAALKARAGTRAAARPVTPTTTGARGGPSDAGKRETGQDGGGLRALRADPPLGIRAAGGVHADAPSAPRRGLLALVPGFGRPMPEPELVDRELPELDIAPPDPERIRLRISDAIEARRRADLTAGSDDRIAEGRADEAEDCDGDAPAGLDASPPTPEVASGLLRRAAAAAEARRVVQPAARRPADPSRRAQDEAQPSLGFDSPDAGYQPPALSLLASPKAILRPSLSTEALEENARMLENVLDDYGVKGEITSVRPGPVVTMYELEPAPGLKASRVIGLSDDIARSMSALSARVSTVPGRTVIGIELPNAEREKVYLRELLATRDFGDSTMRLPLALGKDIGGAPVVANLARMPHLLIAGTTGSGKSVAINTMILSLLYKLSPEECRLIMIDPKMLELSVYDGIPHLLSPVVTDPKKAVVALKWVVSEMEERYRKMSRLGVRNIEGYNGRVREALERNELFKRTVQTGFDEETGDPVFETEEFAPVALPYIVVIVDEMADLMMVAGKEIEACIQRLAQMARASGIHLIMATQRPSVDVITGTIKANFPTRISFQVTSKIDSRTILGEQGAEQLLGMGDMLYMAGGSRITRVHGPFCSDEEVEDVVRHLKSFGPPAYMSGVVDGPDDERAEEIDMVLGLGGGEGGEDILYDQAVAIVARDRKCSTSYIQRKLGIGYNKAARLVEQMELQGVVTPANAVGKRDILVPEA
jgi:S-DNA-T family DNA segregation ATPase FtsK/SpoIIIE